MFKIIRNTFFVLWNICILIFSTTIIFEGYIKDEFSVLMGTVLVITILFGGLSFLLFLIFYEISLKGFDKKLYWKSKLYLKELGYLLIPASLLLLGFYGLIKKPFIKETKQEGVVSLRQVEEINHDKSIDTKTTSETQPVINTPTPILEADPMVNCGIHENCGGGTKLMRESDCEKTICCEIGGNWYFYDSATKCDEDQTDYWEEYYEDKYKDDDEDDDYTIDIPELPPLEPLPPIDLTIPDYLIDVPEENNEEEIKKCEERAREDTKSQIDGCYIKYGGTSAADMCARGVQQLGADAIKACRGL
ncbi:MAG TPA: hypothetical protein PLX95_03880 [bacterium]|nr:hypothetical protein [bacterium]